MATVPLFRPLKARKALYGFEGYVSAKTFIPIGETVTRAREADPTLLFEVNISFGNNSVKVYTDHESAARILGAETHEDHL